MLVLGFGLAMGGQFAVLEGVGCSSSSCFFCLLFLFQNPQLLLVGNFHSFVKILSKFSGFLFGLFSWVDFSEGWGGLLVSRPGFI